MVQTSFNTTTANSTPQVTPATGSQMISQDQMMGSLQGKTITTPQVSTPNLAGTVPFPAPVASPVAQYSPETGVSTQKVADATYNNAITKAVASSPSVPSTATSGSMTPATAGAQRTTTEALLQQYLDQQKAFQQQYLQANTPGAAETATSARLAELKTQAALNQEQALNSGETSSFAGGEAQRVARTDAIKIAGASAELQQLQSQREGATKNIEFLINSGDKSFETQLKIQELQSQVSGIDKQAQDTYFNIAQSEGIDLPYDPTKTATENLSALQKARAAKPEVLTPAKIQQVVTQIVSQFDNEPVVKNYNVVAEGYQFASNIANKEKLTSADNIGLIYAFAKAMDPGSVVREGEYATVQKYAQSWAESFGFNVQRVLTNKEFLTKEAVNNLMSTMNAKYAASEKSFQNIESEYNRKIEEAKSGSVAGSLTDYSKGYSPSQTAQSNSPQNYASQDKAALDAGYTQAEIDAYKKQRGFNQVGSGTNSATQNLTSDFGNMQGLMGQLPSLEYNSTDFGNMQGLMKSAPVIQQSRVEIPKTSSLSFYNNNPGNLRFAGQDGAVKGKGGFAKFNSPEDGLNALMNQIKLDASRGHTLTTFISKFAPSTENDTKLYIQQAMKALGVTKDTPISKININKLTNFMALKESSTKVN